ncbi:hypothetical protein [Pedobacter sp. SYSU D00535]|uniref:hypothetical protein n=1 Tax=Pedobacter sp. SYSU D00535 TaxID=2810308 RepID=UPI001A9716C3|nr:hypothetical protein [Pedobacter sp. SYSU D00535]
MNDKGITTDQLVVLLQRLSTYNEAIGAYCGRINKARGIIAKTTTGPVYISKKQIQKFSKDETLLDDLELSAIAQNFRLY